MTNKITLKKILIKLTLISLTLGGAISLHAQTVIDGTTQTTNLTYYVGNTTPNNTLLITNAGKLFGQSANHMIIGNQSGSDGNSAVVTGSGSTWTNRGWLVVGQTGANNSATFIDGAFANFTSKLIIGLATAANSNSVLISGAGTQVFVTNKADAFDIPALTVGQSGSDNRLIISNGGMLVGNVGQLSGAIVQSNNQVVVTGTGSTWSNLAQLYIQQGFSNAITIRDGALLTSVGGRIGNTGSSSNNWVTIDGAGSRWIDTGSLIINNTYNGVVDINDNRVYVTNGGAFHGNNIQVGFTNTDFEYASGPGHLWVSDTSIVTATNGGGTGNLIVESGTFHHLGGTVIADNLEIIFEYGNYDFQSGSLTTSGTQYTNGNAFLLGNGMDAATFNAQTGNHDFENGIQVRDQARLHLSGTLTGGITVDTMGILSGTGTFDSAIINGAINPGNSPGTINGTDMTWGTGGSYNFEIFDATGMAGVDWDLIDLTGTLTAGNPYTVNVFSMDSMTTFGNAVNFDDMLDYQWTIASAVTSVAGFNSGDFTLNLGAFSNPYTGTWSIDSDGNNVYLNYTASVIPEPSTYALLLLGAICALFGLCRRLKLASVETLGKE